MEFGQYIVSLYKDPYWSIIWVNKSLLLHISGYFYFLLHVYVGEKSSLWAYELVINVLGFCNIS